MLNEIDDIEDTLWIPRLFHIKDLNERLIVKIDALSNILDAILSQNDFSGREHPINSTNRCLNNSENNWLTFLGDKLAVIFALNKFKHF